MSLSQYLHRRPNSQHWQLRVMVPQPARAVLGRAELTRSMRSADRKTAEARAWPVLAEWKRRIADAIAATSSSNEMKPVPLPSIEELEERAVTIGFDVATRRTAELIQTKGISNAGYAALRNKFEERRLATVRELNTGIPGFWQRRAGDYFAQQGWNISNTEELEAFKRSMAHAAVDTFSCAIARMEGKFDEVRPSSTVELIQSRRDNKAREGETLIEFFDCYAVIRQDEGRKRSDTIAQDRIVVEDFTKFIGEQTAVDKITADHVRMWRDALVVLPAGYRRRSDNAGLTLAELAVKARDNNEGRANLTTINKYLSTVSPLFKWLRGEGKINCNPCDGLFYSTRKIKKRRPPFSAAQLNEILRSPLFVGCERDGKEWLPGQHKIDDWRYWIPIICLFTGARIGEIAQLRVDDIREDDGLPYIWIKHDETAGQTTKAGVCRIAGVHSQLIRLGFLEFIGRQRLRSRNDSDVRLFPQLDVNGRGQIGHTPSRFWRTYLTRLNVKSGADGYGAHSFRHGLSDQLRIAGLLDHEIAVALGHKVHSVTGGYGIVQQGTVQRITQMIEMATFKGVDFGHLDRASAG